MSNLNLAVDKIFLIRRVDSYFDVTKRGCGISFSGIFNSCGLRITLCGGRAMDLIVGCEPVIL